PLLYSASHSCAQPRRHRLSTPSLHDALPIYHNESYDILAKKTIVATGGFCNNKELLAEYAPGYEVLTTSNMMGTTGDFVPVFEKDRKSTRLNSSHVSISYAVFCLKKKKHRYT